MRERRPGRGVGQAVMMNGRHRDGLVQQASRKTPLDVFSWGGSREDGGHGTKRQVWLADSRDTDGERGKARWGQRRGRGRGQRLACMLGCVLRHGTMSTYKQCTSPPLFSFLVVPGLFLHLPCLPVCLFSQCLVLFASCHHQLSLYPAGTLHKIGWKETRVAFRHGMFGLLSMLVHPDTSTISLLAALLG